MVGYDNASGIAGAAAESMDMGVVVNHNFPAQCGGRKLAIHRIGRRRRVIYRVPHMDECAVRGRKNRDCRRISADGDILRGRSRKACSVAEV
jgi:hypothetical protein